jgi:hypothetical protein
MSLRWCAEQLAEQIEPNRARRRQRLREAHDGANQPPPLRLVREQVI